MPEFVCPDAITVNFGFGYFLAGTSEMELSGRFQKFKSSHPHFFSWLPWAFLRPGRLADSNGRSPIFLLSGPFQVASRRVSRRGELFSARLPLPGGLRTCLGNGC
jgi:hypothetical protein